MFLFSNCFKKDGCKREIHLLGEQLAAQNKVDMISLETNMKEMTSKMNYIIEMIEIDNKNKLRSVNEYCSYE